MSYLTLTDTMMIVLLCTFYYKFCHNGSRYMVESIKRYKFIMTFQVWLNWKLDNLLPLFWMWKSFEKIYSVIYFFVFLNRNNSWTLNNFKATLQLILLGILCCRLIWHVSAGAWENYSVLPAEDHHHFPCDWDFVSQALQ